MFSSIKRGARLTAVLGLSAAIVVGLAGPAAAAPGQNEATGIVADGLIDAGPFSFVDFPGTPPGTGPFTDTLISANAPGLLSSGTIVTNVSGTSADATVEDLSVTLSALATVNAGVVESECSYNETSGVLSGSATLTDAEVTLLGIIPDIALEASPAPNTGITVPGVAQITLNRQVVAPDGTLTVDAIYINLLSGTQTVTIATSHCHPAVLLVPVIAPQFAAGAGVLGLLVLGFFLYRRRQNSATAAA